MGDEFDSWLGTRLKELEADDVFIPYIRGLLEGDESHDEKTSSLSEMLESMGLDNVEDTCEQIWSRWSNFKSEPDSSKDLLGATGGEDTESTKKGVNLSAALESIADTRTKEYAASRALIASKGIPADKDVKAAIMAHYSQVADNSDEETARGEGGEDASERNVNAEVVAKAEREQREKSRAQAAAKKDKDKEDREKQKKQAEDRKKKAQEKSAKGERKR